MSRHGVTNSTVELDGRATRVTQVFSGNLVLKEGVFCCVTWAGVPAAKRRLRRPHGDTNRTDNVPGYRRPKARPWATWLHESHAVELDGRATRVTQVFSGNLVLKEGVFCCVTCAGAPATKRRVREPHGESHGQCAGTGGQRRVRGAHGATNRTAELDGRRHG